MYVCGVVRRELGASHARLIEFKPKENGDSAIFHKDIYMCIMSEGESLDENGAITI